MEHFVLIKKYGFSEVFLSQISQENHLEPVSYTHLHENSHHRHHYFSAPDLSSWLVWDELFQYAGVVVEIWLSCGNRDQLGNRDDLPLDHEKEKILVTSILCMTSSRKDGESRA